MYPTGRRVGPLLVISKVKVILVPCASPREGSRRRTAGVEQWDMTGGVGLAPLKLSLSTTLVVETSKLQEAREDTASSERAPGFHKIYAIDMRGSGKVWYMVV
jgi:hypothetical protein